jgi:hypothetical protein
MHRQHRQIYHCCINTHNLSNSFPLGCYHLPKASAKLITNPSPDFTIDYDQAAIELIYNPTNGQFYLVQQPKI